MATTFLLSESLCNKSDKVLTSFPTYGDKPNTIIGWLAKTNPSTVELTLKLSLACNKKSKGQIWHFKDYLQIIGKFDVLLFKKSLSGSIQNVTYWCNVLERNLMIESHWSKSWWGNSHPINFTEGYNGTEVNVTKTLMPNARINLKMAKLKRDTGQFSITDL